MIVVALVLCGNQCVNQVRREFAVVRMDAVLHEEGSDLLAVGGKDFSGQEALGVGDFFGGRQFAKEPGPGQQQRQNQGEGRPKHEDPEVLDVGAKIRIRGCHLSFP